MSKFPKAFLGLATCVMAASVAQAQTVAMYGEFHESNGIIGNIPQNPPVIGCVPPPLLAAPPSHFTVNGAQAFQHLDLRPNGTVDARCHARERHANFNTTAMGVFNKPRVGVKGARNIVNPAGGLAVGDPFTIPPFAFHQQLGPQLRVVNPVVPAAAANERARAIETTFDVAMPGVDRNGPNLDPLPAFAYTVKTPNQLAPVPALTRMFSQMNWQNDGHGWDNGLPGTALRRRENANSTVMAQGLPNNEKLRLRYVAGPRQFGGTMALLLDGKGRHYEDLAIGSSMIPFSFRPIIAMVPIAGAGDTLPGFRRRAGIGWDLTMPGVQAAGAGRIKAFQGHGLNLTPLGLRPFVAPPCTWMDPLNPLPAGCNLVNGFDTYMSGLPPLGPGGTLALIPKATSVKHAFGFTTGTVSIVRVANRVVPSLGTAHFSDTITGMGYDTVGLSPMGGVQRNVGLVAGSYTVRTSTNVQVNAQLLGLNLKFTPEPGATAALMSGLGALGLLGHRLRRSGIPARTNGSGDGKT